MIYKIFNNLTR